MAFLEQMAMGKCVIAHRDATMDEYIEDGETGILVDMRAPRRVSADEIAHVRANMAEKAKSLYARWLEDEDKILDSFQNLDASTVLRSPWNVRSLLWYAFYWIEGFGMKLASR